LSINTPPTKGGHQPQGQGCFAHTAVGAGDDESFRDKRLLLTGHGVGNKKTGLKHHQSGIPFFILRIGRHRFSLYEAAPTSYNEHLTTDSKIRGFSGAGQGKNRTATLPPHGVVLPLPTPAVVTGVGLCV